MSTLTPITWTNYTTPHQPVPLVNYQSPTNQPRNLWAEPQKIIHSLSPSTQPLYDQYFKSLGQPTSLDVVDQLNVRLTRCADDAFNNASHIDPKTQRVVTNQTLKDKSSDNCKKAASFTMWHPQSESDTVIAQKSISSTATASAKKRAPKTNGKSATPAARRSGQLPGPGKLFTALLAAAGRRG